jgi:hypothetical protein
MKKVSFIVAATLVIGLFFGFLWGRSLTPPTQIVSSDASITVSDSAPEGTASLMIDYGDGRVRVYPDITVAPGETMIGFLQKQTAKAGLAFKTKEFQGLGVMVETIADKTNGDQNKYWQYWVNNVSIPYAASTYIVKPGDVVEWKFLNYK